MTHIPGLFRNPYPGQSIQEIVNNPNISTEEKLRIVKAEKEALIQRTELPHLYGWKWYPWAAKFRDSTNKVNLLCAANQISKSSTQIRKCIIWGTDTHLWPSLWKSNPVQFWYLYPTQKQVNAEFETKWKLFLPKGEMKDDPYYGWKVEQKKGDVIAIHFNSGVHVYFKTYAQNAAALQTGTCDALFCDEELPIELFDELMFRVSASEGYFHMVFTATLGQEEWRLAMEPTDEEVESGKEFLPQAHKQTVSLYDAMIYEDGTPSHWTLQKIKAVEALCSTHNEVLKRVYGHFIVLEGRMFPSFDIKRHMKPKHPIPSSWLIYEGVDIGAGGVQGEKNESGNKKAESHKSAICFIAVRPDYRAGRVFLGWRGDNIDTTAGDVFLKHQEMVKDNKLNITQKWYDWGNADFGKIAERAGDPFEKAEKSHEIGIGALNTLFKNDMLLIYEDPELAKLVSELGTLKVTGAKNKKKDDFADALRYGVAKIPWDWSFLTEGQDKYQEPSPEKELSPMEREIHERRKAFEQETDKEKERLQDEFDEWNEYYG